MRNFTLILIYCWALSLSAAEMKDPVQDIKDTYQSIKASFNPDQNQFLSIVKNEKVNTYIKDTPLSFWINTINTSNNKQIKLKSKRLTNSSMEYTVLDTVTVDISDLDLPFGKAILSMGYNDDAMCENIEALMCYEDSNVCLGGMYLSYNNSGMIDTLTIKMINDDEGLSTAGKIVAKYTNDDYITDLSISLSYSNLDLDFEDAITFEITYDESDQLATVNLFADAGFTTYVTENMMSIDDGIVFSEERVSLAEIAISRNLNNDIFSVSAIYNNILDTAWQGFKYDITYQDELISEYKTRSYSENGWVDSTALIVAYEYDLNDNLIRYSSSFYDLEYDVRGYDPMVEIFYNENQQMDSSYEYYLDGYDIYNDSEADGLSHKYVYEYDFNGNVIATTESDLHQGQWAASDKYVYEYNSCNLPVSFSRFGFFSHTDSILEYRSKTTFEYNVDNRLSAVAIFDGASTIHYSPTTILTTVDSVTQVWNNEERYFVTWSGEFMQALEYEHYEEDCWEKRDRIELNRDLYENFTGGQLYTYDETEWISLGSLDIEYNTDIELDDMEMPDFVSTVSNHALRHVGLNSDISSRIYPCQDLPISTKLLGYADIDDALNGLLTNFQVNNAPSKISVTVDQDDEVIGGSINFHYSKIGNSFVTKNEMFDDVSQNRMLYPNPATNSVNITGAEAGDLINFYNVNGKQVLQKSILHTSTIDISSLLKGMYIYSVKSGAQESKGKLVVE